VAFSANAAPVKSAVQSIAAAKYLERILFSSSGIGVRLGVVGLKNQPVSGAAA
jgi:hypothetical protein